MTNDELKALCESNARAIQATGEQVGELTNSVTAFIRKLDDEGLKVTLITEVADEIGGDVAYLERQSNRQDVSITALRQDANADRQLFREQAEADRQASDRRFEESNRRFDAQLEEIRAQGQQIRALLSALANTNGRIDSLEAAG